MHNLHESDINRGAYIPDPELALRYFSTTFNSIIHKHVPIKRVRVKNRSNPWFPNDLSNELYNRDKTWQQAREKY